MSKPKLIVIVGPTGAGKTALGILLARKFNGEIVSADSRQVYTGLDLGTAKVTAKEMEGVRHHLLDVADPKDIFTVAEYKVMALKAILEIESHRHLPFLVGGSGFYIDAVVYDIDFPPVPPNKKLRDRLESKNTQVLFNQLQVQDPERAKSIDSKNRNRLVRALEIVDALGKVPSLSRHSAYQTLKLGTPVKDWEEHDKWLLGRLKKRLDEGLVEEVQLLHKENNVSWKRLDELGLEYRWIAKYLQQEIEYNKMVEELWIDIRQYARRQMTWFKRDKDIHWASSPEEAEKLVKDFII